MVVSEKKDFEEYLKKIADGTIDVTSLIQELETGIVKKNDDIYRIEDRWDVKYRPTQDVVLVSEDFMKTVVSATYSVPHEWGGLIFGRVKHLNDNCTIFICERVAIMAQNRSSAEFEIKDEHYQAWGLTPEYIEFVGGGLKRIGWVHSHVNMGCFWSGTDDRTIKQLIAEEANSEIISLVVSKRTDEKLDTAYRPSNRGMRNGIEYLIPDVKKTLPEGQIYLEAEMPVFSELDEEYRATMMQKMKDTEVIERVVTTTTYGADWTSYTQHGTTGPVGGDIDIANFAMTVSNNSANLRTILEDKKVGKRWKMKKLVKAIATSQELGGGQIIVDMLDFFLKTPLRVQQYLVKFKNFADIAGSFKNHVVNLANASPSYKEFLETRYGLTWADTYEQVLVKKGYKTTSKAASTGYVASAVRSNPTGWEEHLKTIDDAWIRKSTAAMLDIEGPMYLEVFKKIVEAFEWRVRSEEDKWPASVANVYTNLKEYQRKIRKKADREEYGKFLIRLMGEAFKGYRAKVDKAKNALQLVINFLPDDLVLPFIYDFVVEFETEEELDNLYEVGAIPVRRKMYGCPICNNWWLTKDDAKKCRKTCEKIEKKKGVSKLTQAEEVDKSPKAQAVASQRGGVSATRQTTLGETMSGGTVSTGSTHYKTDSNICAMSLRYWTAENVCICCGAEHINAENAKKCQKQCSDLETEAVDLIIDGLGYYECQECNEIMLSPQEFILHSAMCSMFGSRLHAILREFCLMYDAHSGNGIPEFPQNAAEEFNQTLSREYLAPSNIGKILLPPMVGWIQEKLKNSQPLMLCAHCGKTYNPEHDPLVGLYRCLVHENECPSLKALGHQDLGPEIEHAFGELGALLDGAPYCEFTQVPHNGYTCEMCNTTIYIRGATTKQRLIQHYVERHGTDEANAELIIRPDTTEPTPIEGHVNLIFRQACYWCMECGGTLGFGTVAGMHHHLKSEHKIDLKKAKYAIHEVPESMNFIADEFTYNRWMENKFKSESPLNQCQYCGKIFSDSPKMEVNARDCVRHEYMCVEKFKV